MNLKFWKRSLPAAYSSSTPPKRRALTRSLLGLFKGGAGDKNNPSWTANLTTPDEFIRLRQRALVARSREQWSNNDYAKAFVRLMRQNVVGPNGTVMQAQAKKPRGGLDKDANDALETAWCTWGEAENCDVAGKLTWRAIQLLCIETAARDGEFFVRKVTGEDAGKWGFALQVIDPQRCPVDYDVERYTTTTFIRHGIEFNRYGKPVAYHFGSTDETDRFYYSYSGRGYTRVPADEIIHGFVTEIAGQKRGLPWMSTGLFRLHHLGGFEDAAVQNARAGASKMGFIQYKDGFGPECDDDTDVASTITAEPLSFHELPEGAELAKFDPQFPSGETAVFVKHMLRGFSSGGGVPYNELANDLEGVNFSSIRQGTLDAREHYKELQQWLIESLCAKVYAAWLPRALLADLVTFKGRPLPPGRIDAFQSVVWQPRRWAWIDPRADVDASVESKNNFLTSASRIIRDQGLDPQTIWTEAARDIRAMIDALIAEGIPEDKATELVMLTMGKEPQKPAPGNANEQNTATAAAA